MKGDTTTENGEGTGENGGHGEPAAVTGEKRPSIVALQNMLKKVSQSPFHQYQSLAQSSSDESSGSSVHSLKKQPSKVGDMSAAAEEPDLHQIQSGENGLQTESNDRLPAAAKNGVNGGLPRSNPFYSYYLESRGQTDNSVFVSLPEFQSSPLNQQDTDPKENQEAHFKPEKDFFHSFAPQPAPDIFQRSRKASPEGPFGDVTLDSPDLFKPFQALNLHNGSQSEHQLKAEPPDFFQPAKIEDVVLGTHSDEMNQSLSTSDSLFNPGQWTSISRQSSNKNDKGNKPMPAKKPDLFSTTLNDNMDIFSPLSLDTVDPFPSPIMKNLDFSSMDDPFRDTVWKLSDPFQDASNSSPDIFQPFSPKSAEMNDMFKVSQSSSKPPRPSPPRPSPPRPSPPRPLLPRPLLPRPLLPRPSPPRPSPPLSTPTETTTSSDKAQEILLTTPQGSQHSILQPTPFIQANDQCASPSQSPKLTHVSTFRRPPKPLPRIRRNRTFSTPPEKPPKPEKPLSPLTPTVPESVEPNDLPEPASPKPPPKPPSPKLSFKPLPKPVLRRKPKTPETKPLMPENFVVFEDILLIGQEQCVEDWPEDSPQNNPDFKPSGTLRLRRESLKLKAADFESEDPEGAGSRTKKKDRKSKLSLVPRRDSKDRLSDECTGRSRTNSGSRKSSKEYFAEKHTSAEENEDPDQYGSMDYKKPHLKDKMNTLLRRGSTGGAFSEQKHTTGHKAKQDPELKKSKKDSFRRWSEGTMLDPSSGDEKESGDEAKKPRKPKLKFVPRRGFVYTEKQQRGEEPRGAHGCTSRKGSKDDLSCAHGNYTPRKKSQGAFMNDDYSEESTHSAGLNWDEEVYESEDLKLKTPRHKPSLVPRRGRTNPVTPEQMRFQYSSPQPAFGDEFGEDSAAQKKSPVEVYNCEKDELDICEPKKTFKLKAFKKPKFKRKSVNLQSEDLPGAAASDYMSEAAQAELMASEKDKLAMGEFEDGDDDGDTDSLMEWWDTVEKWDEVPSDDENVALEEDESKSFSILADKVNRGLRLFNKVFTERAEVLWQSVITLHAIADDLTTFHHKAKIGGITGGTTTAVGGVAAIVGLALAPVTLGASLVVTAVGVGVATAGGIASASAAISDNVNNMNDRKKVEVVLQDDEVHLVELARILHFSNTGLYKLRGHPFLRSGTQHYSQDWEVRRAVQMISLMDGPVMKGTEFIDRAVSSVQGLFRGIDKYFMKDSRELKKGCTKEITAEIKDVANVLNDCIVELNGVREELQEAIGEV